MLITPEHGIFRTFQVFFSSAFSIFFMFLLSILLNSSLIPLFWVPEKKTILLAICCWNNNIWILGVNDWSWFFSPHSSIRFVISNIVIEVFNLFWTLHLFGCVMVDTCILDLLWISRFKSFSYRCLISSVSNTAVVIITKGWFRSMNIKCYVAVQVTLKWKRTTY